MTRLLFIVFFLLWTSHLQAFVCTKDLNGDGRIDPVTEQWTCLGTNPPLCPHDSVDCFISAYTVSGTASISPTYVGGKNGFSRIAAGVGGDIDFSGWSCLPDACTETYAGRITFSQGVASGSVYAERITRIAGNGEKLDVYGCSGSGCTEAFLGSITVSGVQFSGTAAAANGFISVAGDTDGISFIGRICNSSGCADAEAGHISIAGMKTSCPYGSRYGCVDVDGIPRCSPLLCFDETAGGQMAGGQKVCAKDMDGDGNIDFAGEVVLAAL